MENIDESLANLEHDLGIPHGFCLKLREEDDWSFVIKVHALFECAVAEQLTRIFRRKELADVFSRFELSNTKTGKLALIRALNLLPAGPYSIYSKSFGTEKRAGAQSSKCEREPIEYFRSKTANYRPSDLRKFADQWAFAIKVQREEYSNEPIARFTATFTAKEEIPNGRAFDRAHVLLDTPKIAIWFTAHSRY